MLLRFNPYHYVVNGSQSHAFSRVCYLKLQCTKNSVNGFYRFSTLSERFNPPPEEPPLDVEDHSPQSADGLHTRHGVHPEYSDPDADVSIESSDGMRFKVHSVIIRLASKTFEKVVMNPEGVRLEEDEVIVRALLDSIYPRRQRPKLAPFKFVSHLANAASKYDITDATIRIKEFLSRDSPPSSTSALQRYALASRHGWHEEARYISRFSPPPNSKNPEHKSILELMDAASLLKLMNLFQRRQDDLLIALSILDNRSLPEEKRVPHLRWEEVNARHEKQCRSRAYNQATWGAFKLHVLTEMGKHSPDGFMCRLDQEFWKNDGTKKIWEDKCTKCSKPYFDKDSFMPEFARILKRLPVEIE